VISKYLKPEFSRVSLRDLTRLKLQEYFSSMAGTVPYPTISKIRDSLSSILRSTVDADYLIKNPLDGLRLPLDKRPRQPKSTITPEQFHALLALVPEPYASMLFVSVWTGLRVSELIGLKWRCIHADSITVEERFCRRCKKKLWRDVGREQLQSFRLAPWASRRRRDLLDLLDRLTPTIAELTQAVEEEAEKCPEARRLQTHPGVGALTALAFVLIIGRTERFPCGKQLASYLGLVGAAGRVERTAPTTGTHHETG
jgi:hypothetical protein